MSLVGVIGIMFIILKLAGLVTWSWWLVLSPFIIAIGLAMLVLVLYALFGFTLIKKTDKW